jgi:ribosomal protein S27E
MFSFLKRKDTTFFSNKTHFLRKKCNNGANNHFRVAVFKYSRSAIKSASGGEVL